MVTQCAHCDDYLHACDSIKGTYYSFCRFCCFLKHLAAWTPLKNEMFIEHVHPSQLGTVRKKQKTSHRPETNTKHIKHIKIKSLVTRQ